MNSLECPGAATLIGRLVAACLLSISTLAALSAQAATDVTALIGKDRSDISNVFPGTSSIIRNWRGWESALLVSGRDGKLVGVHLQPRVPLAEPKADEAVRQLGVSLEPAKYFAGRDEHGYSDMAGPVRTVIYDLAANGSVTRIRIHAMRADAEE
jgi:hypothetical protein